MKISTSLEHGIGIAGMSCEDSSFMLRDAGFDGVDLDFTTSLDPAAIFEPSWKENIMQRVNAARKAGLELAQCHLPYYPGHLPLPGDGTYETFEEQYLPQYIRSVELCGEIGCPTAVMHPFFKLHDRDISVEGNVRILEKLLPTMEHCGVAVALENVYGYENDYADAYVSHPETNMEIMEHFASPLVGACIDTGHANIFKINIGAAARLYGERLIALHVNGNAGKDEHVIPYTMSGWCEQMDYHDFSAALHEVGYKGFYNLEINPGHMPASVIRPYCVYAAAMAHALADLAE